MRAVRVDSFGGPEVLRVVDVPDPVPGPGQVVVQIEAAGVNRADALTRAGHYHRGGKPPLVLGLEGAGVVVALGEGVEDFRIGQKVLATGAANAPGFYAEKAAVAVERTVALPDDLDLVQAAALPIAWLSAWYCLHHLGRIESGHTVLVHAAASGVGSAAVQIAKDAGARVIAAAGSPAKTEWVAKLGADEVLDSRALTQEQLLARVMDLTDGQGADVVLDTVGGEVFALSLKAAAFGGRVVALANVALQPSTIDTRDFYPKNVSIHGYQSTSLMEHGYDPRGDLEQLVARAAQGAFEVPVDSVFSLEDAPAAHQRLEARANCGKIMISTTL
ncbi:quinone oxidoreductase family protein [Streptacidiphilus fuscans]|uniref:NADPH:quinone oxidoreductase family protein n=1 Tax=Streptacidiphilus fuscans TaxID=2789292 RepID=A0A931B1A1_9ACTN|nr:NADPH:quinone oxidoreductase family protein [Streptacidiphilus fuscans]MBF9067096.1 NADPH:quinone oxidoreductase family protein [Streptacidiphilus fuscans]